MYKSIKSVFGAAGSKFRASIYSRKRNRKFLRKMIWWACISVCVPMLLGGIIYYHMTVNRLSIQIQKDSEASLTLIMSRMERMLQSIEKTSMKLANNSYIKDSFSNPNLDKNIIALMNIFDALQLEKADNVFIEDICYYNNESGTILSNKYGYMKVNDYKYRSDIEEILKMNKQATWAYLPVSSKEGYISYAVQLPIVGISKPYGLIIVQADKNVLQNYLVDSFKINQAIKAYVVNSNDQILLDAARNVTKEFKIEDKAFAKVIEDTSNVGSFFGDDSSSKPVFYTFTKTVLGRTYITMTPKSEITKEVVWIRWLIVLTTLIPLIIGLILTIVNSRRVYNPIEQLFNYGYNLSQINVDGKESNEITYIKECLDYLNKESETLNNYISRIKPSLRETFLHQLLDGQYDNSGNTLYSDCEAHNIPIGRNYVVLVAECDNSNFQRILGANDKFIASLRLRDKMINILDMGERVFKGHIINDSQGKVIGVFYFHHSTDYGEAINNLKEYAKEVLKYSADELNLDVSVGIGRIYPSITDISVSCNEALQALRYRILRDTENILYIDDLESEKNEKVVFYPHELESQIVTYLNNGEIDKAEASLREFSNIVKVSRSYNFIHQSYQMLLSSIVFSFQDKGGSILELLENNLFDQLKECRTSKEIFRWFKDTLFPNYIKLISESQHTNSKMIVMKICKYVKANITTDISLVQCSELVGRSPSYISRLFKKETGMSFLDFVVQCKVDEVKRLLIETDMGISEIAAMVGYSERNLYRIFQRYTRMSPNEYRTANR